MQRRRGGKKPSVIKRYGMKFASSPQAIFVKDIRSLIGLLLDVYSKQHVGTNFISLQCYCRGKESVDLPLCNVNDNFQPHFLELLH